MSTSFQIDSRHSSVEFSIRHLVVGKVRGRLTRFRGTIELAADINRSTVHVELDAASICTDDEQRDTHLRSPDFFDVERFPAITFTSREVEHRGPAIRVTGPLALHGVTRDLTLDVESLGMTRDALGNQRIAFSARARIDRRDFGLRWNQVIESVGIAVGERVDLTLEVEALRVAPEAAILAEPPVAATEVQP